MRVPKNLKGLALASCLGTIVAVHFMVSTQVLESVAVMRGSGSGSDSSGVIYQAHHQSTPRARGGHDVGGSTSTGRSSGALNIGGRQQQPATTVHEDRKVGTTGGGGHPMHRSTTASSTTPTTPFLSGGAPPPPGGAFGSSIDPSDSDSLDALDAFGACLLIKDDNHWLVEWIAFNWFVLPLRHLVVYVDPMSATSPLPVLDRWRRRGYNMTIEVWNENNDDDHDSNSSNTNNIKDAHANHRTRQNTFLQDCMRGYKRRGWNSWILLVDTDEFVAVNDLMRRQKENVKIPSIDQPGSVMTFLKQELEGRQADRRPRCLPIYRLQMCMDEADEHRNATVGGGDWTRSDFLTHNFVRGEGDRDAKNVIDIGNIPASVFDSLELPQKANHPIVHNPVPGYCLDSRLQPGRIRVPRDEALFQAYHYPGTPEQRSFRDDIRGALGSRGGTALAAADKCLRDDNAIPADDLRGWLRGFVAAVGLDEARRLLEGVGRVHSWPAYE